MPILIWLTWTSWPLFHSVTTLLGQAIRNKVPIKEMVYTHNSPYPTSTILYFLTESPLLHTHGNYIGAEPLSLNLIIEKFHFSYYHFVLAVFDLDHFTTFSSFYSCCFSNNSSHGISVCPIHPHSVICLPITATPHTLMLLCSVVPNEDLLHLLVAR